MTSSGAGPFTGPDGFAWDTASVGGRSVPTEGDA